MQEQQAAQPSGAFLALMSVIYLAVLVVGIASLWKIFVKAGQPGWAAIVPFYNLYILLNIVGRPIWWMAMLLLCPPAAFIASIILSIDLAKSFGKDTGFGIGLFFLGIIFGPMLAFGDAQYQGPAAASGGGMAAA
ncbi:signal peptidase I [Corallococcus interemptor]|uniref:Signal peptidase I n=2 Tax=Corallococcus interemptor TaxID=2316720 RepID=A0A3A8QH87_9BACT|nr:signal peptidase I [Corallococcus sp. AB050B]RKH65645.1 signal peptidase I [Corallococcus interemptor]